MQVGVLMQHVFQVTPAFTDLVHSTPSCIGFHPVLDGREREPVVKQVVQRARRRASLRRARLARAATGAGGSHRCIAHGGGPRCDVPGCGKSARARVGYTGASCSSAPRLRTRRRACSRSS